MKKTITLMTLLFALVAGIFFGGCNAVIIDPPPPPPPRPCYGTNGVDGNAFFGLDYSFVEPSYVWGNNPAIPTIFEYGVHYLSPPGEYNLYYEGSFIDGCCLVDYYWDVTYLIWIHPGTAGDCYSHGFDGVDSYLRIFMDPYEPGIDRINKAETGLDIQILEKTDDKIVMEMENEQYTLRATYKKLKESRKAELLAKE